MRLFAIGFIIFGLVISAAAKPQEFTREYEYIASEKDSKVSARENATEQMRAMLLREIGEVVIAEQKMESASSGNRFIYDNYSEKITAVAASMVKMEILTENWTGAKYFIRAKIVVDPSEVSKRANEVLLNHKEMKTLQDKNREISQQVEKLNNEISKLRTKMQDSENFLFAEIREYKIKINDYLARIAQLNKINAEISQKYKFEIDDYKLEAFQKDSAIKALSDAVAELKSELKTRENKVVETPQKQPVSDQKEVESNDCIRVNTEPAGALVYLNDRYSGRTPYLYNNPPRGQISIKVRLNGYQSYGWNLNYNGGKHFFRKALDKAN